MPCLDPYLFIPTYPQNSIIYPRQLPLLPNLVHTHRHYDQPKRDIRTHPLAETRALPKDAHEVVVPVTVHESREVVVRVGRGADCEEDNENEGLEVEEGGLGALGVVACSGWG